MRVLHLTHYFPPEIRGGTQDYVAAVAAMQARRGDVVRVACGSPRADRPGEQQDEERDGYSVTRIFRDHERESFSGDLGSDRIGALLDALVADFDPDVCHIHHWHALTRGLAPRFKSAGRRVVITLHDLYTTCARFFRMPDHRRFCRDDVTFADCAACILPDIPNTTVQELEWVLGQRFEAFQAELAAADRVLAVSRAQRDLLVSLPGFRDPGIEVLPLGLPDDVGEPPPAPAPIPGRLRIVSWGGLDPRKGTHVLVRALAETKDPSAFELHLFGRSYDDAYMRELEILIGDLPVTLHGPYRDEERRDFAARHDLAVFPFLAFETYALVVDEALHLGLPVIVSDHGAPRERIGARGLTVPAGDPAALARLLDGLLADPARLASLRSGAHGARRLADHERILRSVYSDGPRVSAIG